MTRPQRLLLDWYERHGRTHLPWRQTRDPYRILVSEFMLQQTQVGRVLPKYARFLALFPDFSALARARTADVLRAWKGLGYNSRAIRLQKIARAIGDEFGGTMPRDENSLRSLPGIGAYTAGALRAFAFEMDDAAIDTNVRRVAHRLLHGIEHPPAAAPAKLDEDARALVPRGFGHDWNSAMMDLGATVCTARAPKCLLCPLQSECRAAPVDAAALDDARRAHGPRRSPQEALPFEKTTRFVRGRIVDRLRELAPGKRISLLDLHRDVGRAADRSPEDLERIVRSLERDELLDVSGDMVALREE